MQLVLYHKQIFILISWAKVQYLTHDTMCFLFNICTSICNIYILLQLFMFISLSKITVLYSECNFYLHKTFFQTNSHCLYSREYKTICFIYMNLQTTNCITAGFYKIFLYSENSCICYKLFYINSVLALVIYLGIELPLQNL